MAITVKAARLCAGLTQQDIANMLKIHVQTYANLEKHPEKFTIAQAEKFAECVKQELSDIIFLTTKSN